MSDLDTGCLVSSMGLNCFQKIVVFYKSLIGCSTGANEDSPAPTVPASDGSRKKRKSPKENGEKGDDAGSPTIVTPKPEIKIKRSDTAESAPKLSRHVQSRELMKRSPTLHYSPGEDRKPPKKVVKTAVKAKAKSGSSKEVKSKSKAAPKAAPRNPSPKLESPVPATADAVAHALTRQTTLELAPPSPGSDSESASSAEDAGCCKAAGAPSDPPGDDGGGDAEHSLQQVLDRKAAHARYMRFSRSMKSKGFLSTWLFSAGGFSCSSRDWMSFSIMRWGYEHVLAIIWFPHPLLKSIWECLGNCAFSGPKMYFWMGKKGHLFWDIPIL